MSSTPKILILGATGYIGGTVLVDLLKTYSPKDITAVVRNDVKKTLLTALDINVEIGTIEDISFITELVERHDVVVNFAVPFGGGDESIQAIVNGLEKRATLSKSGVKPVLLQTSGTGSILYGSNGLAGSDVWTDSDHDKWDALPDSAYFHSGDRIIARAAERGIISAYIIMSPTVYGAGTGPGNKLSLQIPAYVRYAKRTGQAAYVGKGENIWGNVHVQDLSALYLLILRHSLESHETTQASAGSHGWSNLIYAGLGQHTWKPIVELIGDLLHARREIAHSGAISIEESQGDMYMFGGNSFMAPSEKAKMLGWKQTQPDLVDSIKFALALPTSD